MQIQSGVWLCFMKCEIEHNGIHKCAEGVDRVLTVDNDTCKVFHPEVHGLRVEHDVDCRRDMIAVKIMLLE